VAALFPFQALRPTTDAAALVAAGPYDVVSTAEARTLAAGNPLSFLHVSRAEIDLPPGVDPCGEAVYEKARANFDALTANAPLVVEDARSLYVYRLRMGRHEQIGVAGCWSMDEYDRDVIRKHERTRRDKEDDRTRHMLALRAQTGPVFLTYRSSSAVGEIVERVTRASALMDFTADDGVRHTLWKAAPQDRDALVDAFAGVRSLYIADGHHRAASAARVRQELRQTRGDGEWDSFLAVAFPHDQVQVLAYNRVVKDLGPYSVETLLAELRRRFDVRDGPSVPAQPGDVAMFLNHHWYTVPLAAPAGQTPAERLDVSRLQDAVLSPLLGIGDIRTDTRIDFVGGSRGTQELERLVDTGQAAVAFSMYPVSVDDLMSVCDAGGIMPPKSTWFEPKLRDGLLSHLI
jgi:uncharacterized protein (DUF1015 family)